MVTLISIKPSVSGDSMIMEAQVDTQAELTSDSAMRTCAAGSEVFASDRSFIANKKNDGTWNVVSMS